MESNNVRQLSVEQWCELVQAGVWAEVRFLVNGSSMWPFIRYQKDVVTLAPLKQKMKIGDIVLFKAKRIGGDYVLHRVIRIEADRVLTMGDNCHTPDEWLMQKDILGIAISIQRGKRVIGANASMWRWLGLVWIKCGPIRKGVLLCRRLFIKMRRFASHFFKKRQC